MSVFEKAFQKFWNTNPPAIPDEEIESLRKRVSVVASAFLGQEIEIKFTLEDCGFIGNTLCLPRPKKRNAIRKTDLFLYLTLLASESRRLEAFAPNINSRALFEERRPQFEKSLTENWPGFPDLQSKVLDWANRNLDRTPRFPARISEFDLYTQPGLPVRGAPHAANSASQSSSPRNQPKTERQHASSAQAQTISLNSQKPNPLQHSFEKTETADEYRGGRKMDSGTDDLDLHMEALEQVNLTSVTRDGEAAESVLTTDGRDLELTTEFASNREQSTDCVFFYPEWNHRRRVYLPSHCRLIQTRGVDQVGVSTFANQLVETYRSRLELWRSKMATLVVEPLWFHGRRDGSEVDIDSVVRSLVEIRSRAPATLNLYSEKLKRDRDVEIVLLFDQSQSSDAWIDGHRVLDVAIESVGLMGLIMGDLIPKMTVAGVWSETRHECHFQIVKEAVEPWDRFERAATTITPRGYTRLGPGIRHATRFLRESRASKRILLLFTDGKPTDLDGYEGRQGVQDIRKACLEAESERILPIAFLIGQSASNQAAAMFSHRLHISHPGDLPDQLFQTMANLL